MREIREECGVFGIHDFQDASALTALGLHALQHRGQKDVELFLLMVKISTLKKDMVWLETILQIKKF
jgi:glutamine phosphoribosylpyrophosphate amidotransferase